MNSLQWVREDGPDFLVTSTILIDFQKKPVTMKLTIFDLNLIMDPGFKCYKEKTISLVMPTIL